MTDIRFYFDESVELAVSQQLARAGIDVVSAHSLDSLGESDDNHLQRASALERVLCTYDQDFLRLAAEGIYHYGTRSSLPSNRRHPSGVGCVKLNAFMPKEKRMS